LHISLQFGQNRIDSSSRLLVSPTFSDRTLHESGQGICFQLAFQINRNCRWFKFLDYKMHWRLVIGLLLLGE